MELPHIMLRPIVGGASKSVHPCSTLSLNAYRVTTILQLLGRCDGGVPSPLFTALSITNFFLPFGRQGAIGDWSGLTSNQTMTCSEHRVFCPDIRLCKA